MFWFLVILGRDSLVKALLGFLGRKDFWMLSLILLWEFDTAMDHNVGVEFEEEEEDKREREGRKKKVFFFPLIFNLIIILFKYIMCFYYITPN